MPSFHNIITISTHIKERHDRPESTPEEPVAEINQIKEEILKAGVPYLERI
jgi:hypothetical protein